MSGNESKCPHQWGEWIGYDPMAVEMGISNGFRYHRECMIIGCGMKERAENLIATGKTELVQTVFKRDKS